MTPNILLSLILFSLFIPTHAPDNPPTLIVGADSELLEATRGAASLWTETGVVSLTVIEGCHDENDLNVCHSNDNVPESIIASYTVETNTIDVFRSELTDEFVLCHEMGHFFGLHHRSDGESCMSAVIVQEGPDTIDVEMLMNPSVVLATNYTADVCKSYLTGEWECRSIALVDSDYMPPEGEPWWVWEDQ